MRCLKSYRSWEARLQRSSALIHSRCACRHNSPCFRIEYSAWKRGIMSAVARRASQAQRNARCCFRPYIACHVSPIRSTLASPGAATGNNARYCASARGSAVQARATGLPIDLTGKRVFIAGVADDQGFGWQIAKAMAEAGAEISLGVWVPALKIFETSLKRGKFDETRALSDGSLMEFSHIYPMDAVFDTPQDVPQDIKENKRYAANEGYTVAEVAERVKQDVGQVDVIVHSLANGPEVKKPLLETSRSGYLAAMSASSYSYVSMLQHFGPIMNKGGAAVSLTYLASTQVIPGYGGGMSSAKAALESDTKVLAYEAGQKYGVRVNTISAGPLGSRAAKAIGFIDAMINYSYDNAPITKELRAREVGNVAAFLCSDLASAVTGHCMFVDNGLNVMGVATDSPNLQVSDS